MSRLTDINPQAPRSETASLPAVDWASIGHKAPQRIPVDYQGPNAPLPSADVAVITWTTAEWEALDHVFLDSEQPGVTPSSQLVHDWYLYTRDAPTAEPGYPPLWGYYELVEIVNAAGDAKRVLVFKANAHLAHPPWVTGLVQMTKQVLEDSGCGWLYSIGTAGGADDDERLGDVSVTDAGHVQLRAPQNLSGPVPNDTTVTGTSFPSTDLLGPAQPLLFALDQVVTEQALQAALDALHRRDPDSASLQLSDLVNAPLDPKNLGSPKPLPTPGKALLTTDYYYIASGDYAAQYAVLEMDDTILGYVAQEAGKPFTFVRNVSDPIVPSTAQDGQPISDTIRGDWSGAIYNEYGLYTSFNGAIVTWASIAG